MALLFAASISDMNHQKYPNGEDTLCRYRHVGGGGLVTWGLESVGTRKKWHRRDEKRISMGGNRET